MINSSTCRKRTAKAPAVPHGMLKLCERAGLRLNAVPRSVLEILAEAKKPLGAYELMDLSQRRLGRSVRPPAIYRALNNFIGLGLVAKIESKKAFVLSREAGHATVYFLCDGCNRSIEVRDNEISALIAKAASSVGFLVDRHFVECSGRCSQCSSDRSASSIGKAATATRI
jgi:Fur family transcriptional regulator, zinc uptake regulator